MACIDKAIAYMEENLSKHRLSHINGVCDTAIKLAKIYGADVTKAETAARLHDIAKSLSQEESDKEVRKLGLSDECIGDVNIAHGRIAASWAKDKYGINDDDILNAIRYHTTSRAKGSLLEKIIFVADTVEPGRTYEGAKELLERSEYDIDGVYEYILEWVLWDLKKKGKEPVRDTINAYKEIKDGK